MCRAQVGARGSTTRTNGTSSLVGAPTSTARTCGPAEKCSSPSKVELFPAAYLPGTSGGPAGKDLLKSSFLLFLAIINRDIDGCVR